MPALNNFWFRNRAGKRKEMLMRGFFAVILMIFVGFAYGAQAQPKAVSELDLARYLGTWYEAARFPDRFQRGCVDSKAVYRRIDAEKVSVMNSCVRNGKVSTITGTSLTKDVGKFSVSFFKYLPLPRVEYWVLWVDENYQTAVVGVPSGKGGWILSRTPDRPRSSFVRALDVLRQNGYEPENLIWNGE